MQIKVATLGEIMLRLSTVEDKRIVQSNNFQADYGGGEANVAVSLANLGIETSFITKLPENSLSDSIIKYLNANKVDTNNIVFGGERLGTYYLEVGNGVRASKVIYDRKYSSFSQSKVSDFDLDRCLENITLLHVSGITPALSENCRELTFKILQKAKEKNILVSFDFNYRAKLWTLEEAGKTLKEYLPFIDICFAGHLDAQNILKIQIEKNENDTHEDILNKYYKKISTDYPNIKYFLSTKREINSVDNNDLVGYLFVDGKLYSSKKYNFNIVDRVGGGDAFSAGGLYGILKKHNPEKTIEFSMAASVLKHSVRGDANLVSVDEIESLMQNGVGKIVR